MKTQILNREFKHPVDGRYQIEAKGYHPAKLNDGTKVVQVIDRKAIQSMADNFNTDAAAGRLCHGREMLIDHEHFKHDQDQETTAYGWMVLAEPRPDGLYAEVRWTGTGQPAVDKGDYRFFSTEYDPTDMEPVATADIPEAVRDQYRGYKFMRPLRLDGLSLTNMPNNFGQSPITNRAKAGASSGRVFADEKRQAAAIMNRAKDIRASMPNLSLATATLMAQREEASPVLNRAAELRENVPNLSLASSVLMAQRPVVSAVMNRAAQMRAYNPGLSLARAARLAGCETFNPVANRAHQLRRNIPHLSLATAYIMAQRDLSATGVITNRDDGGPSEADWQAANGRADDVLVCLLNYQAQSAGRGDFREVPPNRQSAAFQSALSKLMRDEELPLSDAFVRLKQTDPVLWVQCVLGFDPTAYAS